MTSIGCSPHAETAPGGCDLPHFASSVLVLGFLRPEHLTHIPLRAWVDFTCARNGTTPVGMARRDSTWIAIAKLAEDMPWCALVCNLIAAGSCEPVRA